MEAALYTLPVNELMLLSQTSKKFSDMLNHRELLEWLSHKYDTPAVNSFAEFISAYEYVDPEFCVSRRHDCAVIFIDNPAKLAKVVTPENVLGILEFLRMTRNVDALKKYPEIIHQIPAHYLIMTHNDELVRLACAVATITDSWSDNYLLLSGAYAHRELTGDDTQLQLVCRAFDIDLAEYTDEEFLVSYSRDYDYAELYLTRTGPFSLFGWREGDYLDPFILYLRGDMSREEAEEQEYEDSRSDAIAELGGIRCDRIMVTQ